MTKSNSSHISDIAHHLHPYTNAIRHESVGPIVMERGEGIYVYDDQGNRYIEGLAGLWSVGVGFGEKRLVEAARKQLDALPFYHTFAHKSNGPAIELAAKLAEITPEGLNHVFFTNSGSEGNDTVIKIVWYYNNALGRPKKKKFLARTGAYHGVTIASASLTGLPNNHRDFDLPAIPVHHLTCPHFYRYGQPGETEAQFCDRLIAELEEVIAREGADTIAAFIGEPIMSAGGVLPPPEGYWARVQEICRKNDILVVADEVITGFGRLGTAFGSDFYGIKPDLMTLSKQITSSYQPLAAVMISDEVYRVIAENSGKIGTFGHGYTASGHPVATAVGLENVKIIEERGLVANAAAMGKILHQRLAKFRDHPLVGEVRGAGLLAAVELVADKDSRAKFPEPGKVGGWFFNRAHSHGLIVRNIGDALAFCPPLIITEAQIDEMVKAFEITLDETATWVAAGMPA
ncbi:aspartate aminotransferase family protein [Paracoccus aminophilus]|uniref:Adenosylmethionine-8-amino-7-oxononanoate aminotransferase n=1 Tax=Paracoccus aminophilus JCM 7686 TaxID=1367847 RepID=S5XXV5_PARAH|nr:aspartate aminotransferase family protein [Paracoccus aminophilus]AGT08280.1 adenosylmethionine-8-amino-7-oxononanoate aminotransferase [Paracoccus aminophilus JCM 7686]